MANMGSSDKAGDSNFNVSSSPSALPSLGEGEGGRFDERKWVQLWLRMHNGQSPKVPLEESSVGEGKGKVEEEEGHGSPKPSGSGREEAQLSGKPAQQQQKQQQHPFPQYTPTPFEPCALDATGTPQPIHLLSCGHLAAVDDKDHRCALNCLHVATWITQQTLHQSTDKIDLAPGIPLGAALTSSRPRNPIQPESSRTQALDRIFCELCRGQPVDSYEKLRAAAAGIKGMRRAFSLTRAVMQHFLACTLDQSTALLSAVWLNVHRYKFDERYVHRLRCGHTVWAEPLRPCAANCTDAPVCEVRRQGMNIKQGDAIVCKECTCRAEHVYARYALVAKALEGRNEGMRRGPARQNDDDDGEEQVVNVEAGPAYERKRKAEAISNDDLEPEIKYKGKGKAKATDEEMEALQTRYVSKEKRRRVTREEPDV